MTQIRMESISKTFPDGTEALDSVCLEVNDGELMALVGPSGCGKTTLLRILAGLEHPSEGKILFNQEDISSLSPHERDLGLVFQNYALFPHLTVERNIAIGLQKSFLSKSEKKEKIAGVATDLGIYNLLQRKPSELSGGQRQRVALARLLTRNPSIHLLDEPLSNLDANLRGQMREELAKLHREHKKTTILVTHDQVEAMTLGERICVLNKGKIEQVGVPKTLYENPKNLFVACFFGSPPISIFHGSIECCPSSGRHKFIGSGNLEFELPDRFKESRQNLTLGVRPEHFKLMFDSPKQDFLIQRIEYLGDCQVLHLQFEEHELTAKTNGTTLVSGQNVGFEIDWGKVFWFDATSQSRIQL
ncbi:MAG: ABC transporter ATP-binding protein [Verrucomicrobiota bacterium]|nr:ABC transporter ATP-binding protein [Verrucomicrobiota bacterium]